MRIKRLKQPKYLLGAIAGCIYFYFYFWRYLFQARPGAGNFRLHPAADLLFYESAGALVLLIIILAAWIFPHQRTSLAFTESEIAFLFPAPITRRGLIHFKLLRSQTAILFTTLLLTLITNRLGGRSWIAAAGWWLILSTLNLHLLAASFARTKLLDRGITNWQRRISILAIILVCVAAIVLWAKRTIPAFQLAEFDPESLKRYFQQVLASGPAPYLLYPFRLVVRPYLAANAHAFLLSLPPALLLMLLQYAWVVRADVAFEEASVEASRKMAEKVAAIRAGNWRNPGQQLKKRRPPFTLKSTGVPAVAILWKNLISAGQAFSPRLWIILVATAGGTSIGLAMSFGKSGWLSSLGIISAMLVLWSLIFGPTFLRQDFRQDLSSADILKSYPIPGWQIALGELLAPSVILTCVQWFLLILAAGFLSQAHDVISSANTISVAIGAAIVLPMINLITLQIPNCAILLFPAWFQSSRDGAHGIEATGQRLLSMFGQLLAIIIAMIPAVGFFIATFYVLKLFLSISLVIPAACLVATAVLGIEAALGLVLLGWLFKRLDLSSEPNLL